MSLQQKQNIWTFYPLKRKQTDFTAAMKTSQQLSHCTKQKKQLQFQMTVDQWTFHGKRFTVEEHTPSSSYWLAFFPCCSHWLHHWCMHYFIVLVFIWVCVKCFNIDAHIYSTRASSSFPFCFILAFCHVDIDVYIYSTCALFDCQVDFDVDNVQRHELVNISYYNYNYNNYYYHHNQSHLFSFYAPMERQKEKGYMPVLEAMM